MEQFLNVWAPEVSYSEPHEVAIIFVYQENQAERVKYLPKVTQVLRDRTVCMILSTAVLHCLLTARVYILPCPCIFFETSKKKKKKPFVMHLCLLMT